MASTRRPQGPSRPGGANSGPRRVGGTPAAGAKPGAGRAAGGNGAPRRLGNQAPPQRPSGAQRRYDRSRRRSSSTKKWAWAGIGAIVALVVALVLINVTGGSNSPSTTISGADRNPAPAPAAEVKAVTTIPASVFNSVGVAGQPAAFAVTANQPKLTLGGKARFVYEGGEYCPYCAVTRYAMVAALSRFGSFSNLKETASGPNDGNIPTFSFLGSSYSSKYVAFSPYEAEDRLQNPLQKVPTAIDKLYLTYDGNPNTGQPSKFGANLWSSPGIPFLDIANKYVVAGASPGLNSVVSSGVLQNGGPGRLAIAQAIHAPNSSTGKAIQANQFIVEANYITAAICAVNGNQPGAVCSSPGVTAAAKKLAAVKAVG